MQEPVQPQYTNIVTPPKKNIYYLYIAIVLGIVFLFAVSQVAYYFYNKRNTPVIETQNSTETVNVIPTPSPGQEFNIEKWTYLKKTLENFGNGGNYFEKATIETVYQGTVIQVADEERVINNKLCIISFTMLNERASSNVTFHFTAEDLKVMTITTAVGIVEGSITKVTDIKPNDFVKITMRENLLNDGPTLIEIVISRPQ
jgi:hypothetical protein